MLAKPYASSTDAAAKANNSERGGWFDRWITYLQTPIDGSSLALFRICFGLAAVVNIYLHQDEIAQHFIEPRFTFPIIEGLQPLPGIGMFIIFGVMAAAAACIALGFQYRAATAIFALTWTYSFLLDKTYYQNHFYLICLLAFLFALMPANRVWALDNVGKPQRSIPRWTLLAFKLQLLIVYFYGGIAKLNPDWLHGEPISHWILARAGDPFLGQLDQQQWFIPLIVYGGILIDLSVGFLLLWRRTFWFGCLLAVPFHLMNSRLFQIGVFPWLMLASIGLFASPDWPCRALARLPLGRFGKNLVRVQQDDGAGHLPPEASARISPGNKRSLATIALLHIYFVVQILVPLRRFMYPGDFSWDEQAHRFSWAMMLRHKDVQTFEMTLTDPKSGKSRTIPYERLLNHDQITQLARQPGMALQLAHYVADDYQRVKGVRPAIRVTAVESLNFRSYQPLIDPDVDLAAEPLVSLAPYHWVVPLRPR